MYNKTAEFNMQLKKLLHFLGHFISHAPYQAIDPGLTRL